MSRSKKSVYTILIPVLVLAALLGFVVYTGNNLIKETSTPTTTIYPTTSTVAITSKTTTMNTTSTVITSTPVSVVLTTTATTSAATITSTTNTIASVGIPVSHYQNGVLVSGRTNCLLCHKTGLAGAKPIPEDHEGRTNDLCQTCHLPVSP
jgi:hypothetical protein